ncbi:MAG: hypothetical protein P4L40_15075, partial [Terracidiphilus sp.]|nr:hypothetical protein [Terracidiphilus sp.]
MSKRSRSTVDAAAAPPEPAAAEAPEVVDALTSLVLVRSLRAKADGDADAVRVNTTSSAKEERERRLSPFFPHGGITVPLFAGEPAIV